MSDDTSVEGGLKTMECVRESSEFPMGSIGQPSKCSCQPNDGQDESGNVDIENVNTCAPLVGLTVDHSLFRNLTRCKLSFDQAEYLNTQNDKFSWESWSTGRKLQEGDEAVCDKWGELVNILRDVSLYKGSERPVEEETLRMDNFDQVTSYVSPTQNRHNNIGCRKLQLVPFQWEKGVDPVCNSDFQQLFIFDFLRAYQKMINNGYNGDTDFEKDFTDSEFDRLGNKRTKLTSSDNKARNEKLMDMCVMHENSQKRKRWMDAEETIPGYWTSDYMTNYMCHNTTVDGFPVVSTPENPFKQFHEDEREPDLPDTSVEQVIIDNFYWTYSYDGCMLNRTSYYDDFGDLQTDFHEHYRMVLLKFLILVII